MSKLNPFCPTFCPTVGGENPTVPERNASSSGAQERRRDALRTLSKARARSTIPEVGAARGKSGCKSKSGNPRLAVQHSVQRSSESVTYRCQECGHVFKTTLGEVIRSQVRCAECGATNELAGGVPSSYPPIVREINQQLESSRAFRNSTFSSRYGGRRRPVTGGTSGGVGRVRGLYDHHNQKD